MKKQNLANPGYLPVILAMIVGILSLLPAGCTRSSTTPKGPLGNTFDLRSELPAEVKPRVPSDGKAIQHKAEVQIGEPVARVLIKWLNWSSEQKMQRLRFVANNSRFLILPGMRIKNLASRVLSLNLKRLPRDWQRIYGYPILLAETFVDHSLFEGTCYRASG